jgi:hypothetical protein
VLGKSSAHWCLFAAVALAPLLRPVVLPAHGSCPEGRRAKSQRRHFHSTHFDRRRFESDAAKNTDGRKSTREENRKIRRRGAGGNIAQGRSAARRCAALTGDGYVCTGGSRGRLSSGFLAGRTAGIADSEVIVADSMDGNPLGDKLGPFRLVAPHEKRPARWIRMLRSITVVRATVQ